jgi:hypothetical protein
MEKRSSRFPRWLKIANRSSDGRLISGVEETNLGQLAFELGDLRWLFAGVLWREIAACMSADVQQDRAKMSKGILNGDGGRIEPLLLEG